MRIDLPKALGTPKLENPEIMFPMRVVGLGEIVKLGNQLGQLP